MARPLGLCVSPRVGISADDLAELRPRFLRSILYADADLDWLLSLGLPLHLTINNEWDRVAGWAGWDDAVRHLAARSGGLIRRVDCGNELDRYWAIRADDVPPEFAADLVARAAGPLRAAGIRVGTPALGGPRWPEYLRALLERCAPDYVALNPYGWVWETLDAKVASAREVAGLPVALPELGAKVGDAGGEEGHAAALARAAEAAARLDVEAAWFAHHELIGTPEERGDQGFGLLRADGSRRPAYAAFAGLAEVGPPVVVPPAPEPFPLPAFWPSKADVLAAVPDVAEEYGLPPRLLLLLLLGESGHGLQAFDRWYRYTDEALGCIERRDRAGLRDILARCAAVPTNDFSFGPAHQAWRWSPEFDGNPYDLDAILRFRQRYIQDHGHALRVAAAQLGRARDRVVGDTPDAWLDACALYNKPSVAPRSNPARAVYARGLPLLAELLPDAVPPPVVVPPPAPSGVAFEDYPDPAPAGSYGSTPRGVILHGSRSGRAGTPKDVEYRGTASYERTNRLPEGGKLGWTATIGDGVVAVHLDPRTWGWNARAASSRYLAVEFAQATRDEPISDGQVDAFCAWYLTRARAAWPDLPASFPTHAEVERSGETGARDGKDDVFPDARADELRARILARLSGAATEEDPAVIAELEAKLRSAEGINAELGRQLADKDGRLMRAVEGLAIVADDLVPLMAAKGAPLKRRRALAEQARQIRLERTA